MGYLAAISGLALLLFGISFYKNQARILNGVLANSCLLLLGLLYFMVASKTNHPILMGIALVGVWGVAFLLVFGLYILLAFLFINARIVLKRERKSLGNSLTLLLGAGILLFLVISAVANHFVLPLWLAIPWSGLLFVLAYQAVHVLNFLSAHFLCNLVRPRKHQHYIIVLGSGLIKGKVPPLLAARVDRAIAFYHKQQKIAKPPKLIVSGGQGGDEPRSEAKAMEEYALAKGIPPEDILLEDQAANTYQNMKFSKKIIEQDWVGTTPYHCLYSTSRYHLLRAGIYAKKAGLRAMGIGAKTALYYWPNAMLREFIAIQMMYRKKSLLKNGLLFLAGAMVPLLPYLLDLFVKILENQYSMPKI